MGDKFEKVKTFYFSLWPSLNEDNWSEFEKRLIVKKYEKGNYILRPGEVCNCISFINYGLVRSYYLVDGREITTNFFVEDSVFSNYQSFLSRTPSLLYTDVLEDTEMIDVDYDSLQYAYENIPDSERVGRLVAEQLYILLSARNASLLMESPEQRYIKVLQEKPDLIRRVPQYMVASYLGVTPEALSRIRSRISKRNAELLTDTSSR